MILQRVMAIIEQRKAVSPTEVAAALDSSVDAVRGMLDILQRRGLVHRVRVNSACGTQCRQCAQADGELYAPGVAAPSADAVPACRLPTPRS